MFIPFGVADAREGRPLILYVRLATAFSGRISRSYCTSCISTATTMTEGFRTEYTEYIRSMLRRTVRGRRIRQRNTKYLWLEGDP